MRSIELTETQKKVLAYIKSYISDNGYPPSRKDIGDEFVFTSTAAQFHVSALARKGAIELKHGVSRGIKCLV